MESIELVTPGGVETTTDTHPNIFMVMIGITREGCAANAGVTIDESHAADLPIWDEHAFDELRAVGGDALVKRVVRQSIEDAEFWLDALSQASTRSSPVTWRDAVHALYGVARGIGATRLSELLADAIEHDRFSDAQRDVVTFAQEFSAVRALLAAMVV